ncbi:hypothetical protein EDD18DRAFT_1109632 [Armillaria luteobubalina]|uniref:Uncharacterized protein n=1 Tax=Armillaria luteobubalina TaxID=153913 RepID=A0AA39UN76_9AGAR|nr:hypothetical protein EDD18DRAFT_1109632 [Armillaria luteobubalina]
MSLILTPAPDAGHVNTFNPTIHSFQDVCCSFCHQRLDFSSTRTLQIPALSDAAMEFGCVWYLSKCGHFLDTVCAYHHMQVRVNIPLGQRAKALRDVGYPIMHPIRKVWQCPSPDCQEIYTSVLSPVAIGWTMENTSELLPFLWGWQPGCHQGWGSVTRATLSELELGGRTMRDLLTAHELFVSGLHATNRIRIDWEPFHHRTFTRWDDSIESIRSSESENGDDEDDSSESESGDDEQLFLQDGDI